ncbi:MAG: hypothetical protein JSR99_16545 [Proteobacteria bacterium]|nr:hypothetical protein [Pseudomonadota bacterium]
MYEERVAGSRPLVRTRRRSGTGLFVMMSVALFLTTGAALDYARVVSMREGIEFGVKSAAQAAALVLRGGQVPDDEITSVVMSHFDKDGAFARHVGTIEAPNVIIDHAARAVTVDAKGTVMMTVSRLIGLNDVTVPATFTTNWAPDQSAQDIQSR